MTGNELKVNIAKNIKKYRMIKYPNMSEAARKLGVARQQFEQWERGRSIPRAQFLCDLSDLLEVSVFNLLEPYKEEA